jgi:hypothetical protein
MHLIDHHAPHPGKGAGGIVIGQQQRQTFGRGQQDMRRVGALAAALGIAGVAGAILDPDRQPCAFDGGAQVAADVGGQRLQRRDVEGVQARPGCRPQFGQRGQEPGQRLAPARGRDQQVDGASARASIACWWGCSAQPRAANQSDKGAGRAGMAPS